MENNKMNTLCIHILANGLTSNNKTKFLEQSKKYNVEYKFHNVDESILENCKYRKKVHKLSKAAYYRILLPSVLPNIEKVIYIDCDMIILGNIKEIWDIEIEKGIYAVEDYGLPYIKEHRLQLDFNKNSKYFNSGFLLINLNYWRKYNIQQELLNFAEKNRVVFFHDQDALNYVFKDNWFRLAPKWNHFNIFHVRTCYMFENKTEYDDFFKRPMIIHYSDKYFKPWFKTPFIPYKKYWLYYKNKSMWHNEVQRSNEKALYTIFKIIYLQIKIIYKRILKYKFLILR